MIDLLKYLAGVGIVVIGWTITALIVEARNNEGHNADYIGIIGCLVSVLIGGWILSTI